MKRLNRGLGEHLMPFGSPDYGKEELIAEMAASYLCGHAGIAPAVIENQAAYLSGWLGRLKQDKKLIIQAAAAGQRAADWIRGQRFGAEGQGNEPDSAPESIRTVVPMAQGGAIAAPAVNISERKIPLTRAARDYIHRGFAPVPIPAGQKGPVIKGWQHLRLGENEVNDAFAGAGNLGLLLGEASGHLVDVDLDCPEARELADRFLPPTAGITGRPGSPRSHRWYICPDIQTVRRRDPVDHSSIVELRGDGSQTLVGPSIHPSGDPYDYLEGEPAKVDSAALIHGVDQLAAEVIRRRHGEIQPHTPPAASLPSPTIDGDQAHVLGRAAAYLGAMPPAISGQAGHNAAYAAATALVHGFCLSEEEAFTLLADQYNPRCQPPWSDRELLHKVTDAAKHPHTRQRGWLLSAV